MSALILIGFNFMMCGIVSIIATYMYFVGDFGSLIHTVLYALIFMILVVLISCGAFLIMRGE